MLVKKIILLLVLACYLTASAQKKAITLDGMNSWTTIERPQISGSGRLVAYQIKEEGTGKSSLILKSTVSDWEKRIPYGTQCYLQNSADNVYFKSNDTLYVLKLGAEKARFISKINSVDFFANSKNEWCLYKPAGPDNLLVIHNLNSKKQIIYKNVSTATVDKGGKFLAIVGQGKANYVMLHNLPLATADTIWSSEGTTHNSAMNIRFGPLDGQLAFWVKNPIGVNVAKTLWYYNLKLPKAIALTNDNKLNTKLQMVNSSPNLEFSEKGDWIFISMKEPKEKSAVTNANIWTYRDSILRHNQMKFELERQYKVAISLTRALTLIKRVEWGRDRADTRFIVGDKLLVADSQNEYVTWHTNVYFGGSYFRSLTDGSTSLKLGPDFKIGSMSPTGKYIIYYNDKDLHYYSLNTSTEELKNITSQLPYRMLTDNENNVFTPIGLPGWSLNGKHFLAYDEFDLWQIDPSGDKPAVCLTKLYGRKHKIKLRMVYENSRIGEGENKNRVLLTGFGLDKKYNGFFEIGTKELGTVKELSFGPYHMYMNDSQKPYFTEHEETRSLLPLKAGNANIWMIKKTVSSQSSQFCLTNDFKSFTTISNNRPEKDYNWLTTQLVDWKQVDGEVCQGILYKPENFDPTKKYPVIVTFYEKNSHTVYQYPFPRLCRGPIDISWFVSRGYIVFVPDVHYKVGRSIAEDMCNSVVPGVTMISRLSFVDSALIGVQGHSFGGHETNDLITHSNLFAAACESAGVTNVVSSSGALNGVIDDLGTVRSNEYSQGRLGKSLWVDKALYIECSAIFHADKITAPLLILHNKKDGGVPWWQGMEMYLALNRLSKPCWMLDYDDAGHVLGKKDSRDFTIRVTQFFDHYLKGKPAPYWMTQSLPAKSNYANSYDLDPAGTCKKNCKICSVWNDRVAKDSEGTKMEIKEWTHF